MFFLLFAFHFSQLTDVTIGLKSKKIKWEESNISSVGKIIFILFLFPVDINHKIITYLKKLCQKFKNLHSRTLAIGLEWEVK